MTNAKRLSIVAHAKNLSPKIIQANIITLIYKTFLHRALCAVQL